MRSPHLKEGAPSLSPRFLRRQGGVFDFVLKRSNVVNQLSERSRQSGVRIQPTAQAVGEEWRSRSSRGAAKEIVLSIPSQPCRLIPQQRQRQPVLILRLRAPDLGL